MNHGFTGTRLGTTLPQRKSLSHLLTIVAGEFHHGGCDGSDIDAHYIAKGLGWFVVIHPPTDRKLYMPQPDADLVLEPKSYLVRNRHIVDDTDVMIATPAELTEQPHGGTWYTIRYARKVGKPLYIVWPDGRLYKDPRPI